MKSPRITRRRFLNSAAAIGLAPGLLAQSHAPTRRSPTTGTPLPAGSRPRLYFNDAEFQSLKTRWASNPKLRAARSDLIQSAEKGLLRKLPAESWARAGKTQHGNYFAAATAATESIENCGVAYAITGERRFADRALEGLRHFSKYEAWTGREFFRRDPPWHSALETAHFTKAYAIGIDCLGDALRGEDLQSANRALARLGVGRIVADWLDPERRIHALDSMGHNWWMVCVGAAGLGAMGLMGFDERAREWLRLAVEGVPEFFSYPGNILQNKPKTFDPAGGLYEGLGYANYTLLFFVYLQAALVHLFPKGWAGCDFHQLPPRVPAMIDFFLNFTYPRTPGGGDRENFLTAGFGDDRRHTLLSPAVSLFLARMTGDGRYRWYFDHYSQGKVSGLLPMVFYEPDVLPDPVSPEGMPRATLLSTIGWASLRDSWRPDATFLAIKCGDTWNHAHADAASFVIDAGGEPLLIDPGTCSYSRPEYHGYYAQSKAHNVVLFNGEGQPYSDLYRGAKFPGKLHGLLGAEGARYVLADATGPYALHFLRFYRHFLWLDQMILVVDDLLSHQPGQYEWLFHGEHCPEFKDSVLSIRNRQAELSMNVLFPHGLVAHQRPGLAFHDPEVRLPYLSLQLPQKVTHTKFLAVIRAGRNLPDVKIVPLQGKEWIGARLRTSSDQWTVYCNLRADGRRMHVNSNAVLDDWETDAFLLAVRQAPDARGRPGAAAKGIFNRLFIGGGSYLRSRSGRVWFDCLSKCDLVVSHDSAEERMTELVAHAPSLSHLRFRGRNIPEKLVINGSRPAGSIRGTSAGLIEIVAPRREDGRL